MSESFLEKAFDYEGCQIVFRNKDGKVYVNATQMAKAFGKRPNDYLALSSTNELIRAITRFSGNADNQVVITIRGGFNPGTWFHEDLALDFAQWLSVEFRVWCNMRIKEILTTGSSTIDGGMVMPDERVVGKVEDETRAKLYAIKFYMDNLRPSDASKQLMLESVYEPLGIPLPDYVPSMGVKHSATELLRRNGINMKTKDFNILLQSNGLLTKISRESTSHPGKIKWFWSITDSGLRFGENEVSRENTRETQPLWFDDKFVDLLKEIGLR